MYRCAQEPAAHWVLPTERPAKALIWGEQGHGKGQDKAGEKCREGRGGWEKKGVGIGRETITEGRQTNKRDHFDC